MKWGLQVMPRVQLWHVNYVPGNMGIPRLVEHSQTLPLHLHTPHRYRLQWSGADAQGCIIPTQSTFLHLGMSLKTFDALQPPGH